MKNALKTGFVGILALAIGACNPAKFDDLKDEMWVQASGAPDGLDSNDYANGIVWGGNTSAGAKIYAVGNRPAWAQLDFASNGGLSNNALRVNSFLQGADVLSGVPSVAADPDSVGGGVGTVALGTSQSGSAFVVLLDPDSFAFTASVSLSNGTELVDALAMGPTSSGGAGSDVVAIRARPSDSRITIITEYAAGTDNAVTCTLAKEEGYAATIANLDPNTTESEIIVGMGARSRTSGTGEVIIFDGSLVDTADGLNPDGACTDAGAFLMTIPGTEPDFGAAVVVGDFDGDGANGGKGNDLAVSAPSANKVYVFFNLDTNAALPTPLEITPPPGVESYGHALAAGDFDGNGTDELVIGDPRADVDAVVNSGRADIVEFSGGAVSTTTTVLDAEAENSQNFGRAITVAGFDGNEILVIGAKDEVFTYFRTPVDGDVDDRQ